MSQQNYKNHSRLSPIYHGVLFSIVLVTVGLSLFWFFSTIESFSDSLPQLIFVLLSVSLLILMFQARVFALKAQDRAIRAEESLRHFILSGKPVSSELRLGQIIALRFASDEELLELTKIAIEQKLTQREIKSRIKNWKADTHRV